MTLVKHAAVQYGAALGVFLAWAAADSWYIHTGMILAGALSLVLAALTGFAAATVIHEWFHLLGARSTGAAYKVPDKPGLFIYDYDFAANTLRQFNVMSVAGQLGSWVAVFGLMILFPPETPGRAMLAAGAAASAVFAGVIEVPPLLRAQQSGDPFAELSRIDTGVLKSAGVAGMGTLLLSWYLIY